MRIRHQITHRMMYGFAFIRAQCGPLEEKTEMTVARVGSNLKAEKAFLQLLIFVCRRYEQQEKKRCLTFVYLRKLCFTSSHSCQHLTFPSVRGSVDSFEEYQWTNHSVSYVAFYLSC